MNIQKKFKSKKKKKQIFNNNQKKKKTKKKVKKIHKGSQILKYIFQITHINIFFSE